MKGEVATPLISIALLGPVTGPLSATTEVVEFSRSPLSAALASLWLLRALVRPGSPMRLAAMSCLPAEVTVSAVRYWSARGPLLPVWNRSAASRGRA